MNTPFIENIIKKKLFNKQHHLLLAVSGGVDSVVLAHLLAKNNYYFSMAHCNFNLRASESLDDEEFCKQLSQKLGVAFHTITFDTKKYASEKKLSIQMAARELRYNWFKELMQANKADFLLTAHHANDVTETVFINLLRGTGINGMKGIQEKRGNIIRPLLSFTKQDIDVYAKNNNIKFRLDKSNLDDKYERNYLRLKVVPLLKKLNPSLEKTFAANSKRLSQEADLLNEYLKLKTLPFIEEKGQVFKINLGSLKSEPNSETLLHFLLHPFGFNQSQMDNMLQAPAHKINSGQLFYSDSHRASISRQWLMVDEMTENKHPKILIHSLADLKKLPHLQVKSLKEFSLPSKKEVILTQRQLVFPLTIRYKQTGDKFKPFGMKHFKLLSDFFREEKLSVAEKENTPLLVNGNGDIIWVIGHRSDERYRLTANEGLYLKLIWHG